MSDLKTCPFCGSNKIITRKTRMWHRIVCEACGSVSGYWFNKEQAIAAWNQRAERTCELEEPDSHEYMNLMICSSCGMKTAVANYCCWCGAKVVE